MLEDYNQEYQTRLKNNDDLQSVINGLLLFAFSFSFVSFFKKNFAENKLTNDSSDSIRETPTLKPMKNFHYFSQNTMVMNTGEMTINHLSASAAI